MAETSYALIKGIEVVNTAIFNNPNYETISYFKEFHNVDEIIACPEYIFPGCTYQSGKFIAPKPYDSWILNLDLGVWEAPIPQPEQIDGEEKTYSWDEASISWVVVTSEDI